MIECPKCHQENLDTAKRCINCLADLENVKTAVPVVIEKPRPAAPDQIATLVSIDKTLKRIYNHLTFYSLLIILAIIYQILSAFF